nr:ribonuclease H-like domain-containing protein [Tanacetum cinerariifolium]
MISKPFFSPKLSPLLVSFFLILSLGLKSHVEQDTVSTNPDWCQLDDLIKMWILGSLCDSLQEQVVTTPGNAKALWGHLKNLFQDNKNARTITLDNELRSIKIGKMTVNEYCTKIQSMANRLKNLDCQESSFNDQTEASTMFESSSSSPTILMASSSSEHKDPNWCNAMYDEYNLLVKMAQLVANGSSQQLGVDFDETFSLVVYMHQPHGFVDSRYPNHVCLLQRSLHGLNRHLVLGFSGCLFTFICVDDIILTASSLVLLQQIVDSLHKEFDMTDLEGTLELSLHLYAFATTSLVRYTDVDWVGCPSTRMSTSGYCVCLGDNHLSWFAKRQHTISCSSAEAKYRGVANVVSENAWIRNLLRELHSLILTATLVYRDNVSADYMSANLVQHQRTKHIEIDIHFIRDMVKAGHVRVLRVPSRF